MWGCESPTVRHRAENHESDPTLGEIGVDHQQLGRGSREEPGLRRDRDIILSNKLEGRED
jgi:hypothetical protein